MKVCTISIKVTAQEKEIKNKCQQPLGNLADMLEALASYLVMATSSVSA